MTKKSDKECHESIKKLKSLRVKLCNQQSSWKESFKSRDFVINELQDMHKKLTQTDEDTSDWCKKKVEYILTKILDLSCEEGGEQSDD